MRGSIARKGNKEKGYRYYPILEMGRDEITGKRNQKWLQGFSKKKDAENFLVDKLKELQTGSYIEPTKQTMRSYMEQWLKDKETQVRSGTMRQYNWLTNTHVIPNIGTIKLAKLTPERLQKFYTDLQQMDKPLSNRTIRHIHNMLHGALNRAVKWGLVARNEVDKVDPPKPEKIDMRTWNEDDINAFLEEAENHRLYIAFLLAITTGMRKGEILGLRWVDVDYEASGVSVTQSLSRTVDGQDFVEPKTKQGKRFIALPQEVMNALRTHHAKQAEDKLKEGPAYNDHGLVLQTIKGLPLKHNYFNAQWYKLLKRAGVPKIRFHDLRHTHATLMLKQGEHAKVIQERLGHSSITVTMDTYSHVLPGLQKDAADRFAENVLRRKSK